MTKVTRPGDRTRPGGMFMLFGGALMGAMTVLVMTKSGYQVNQIAFSTNTIAPINQQQRTALSSSAIAPMNQQQSTTLSSSAIAPMNQQQSTTLSDSTVPPPLRATTLPGPATTTTTTTTRAVMAAGTGPSSVPDDAAVDVRYKRAFRESGGFFDDVSDAQWALMKDRVASRMNHYDANNWKRNVNKPNAWYQENFEPDFTCLHERRIGGMGDGPKWVCDPHRLVPKKDDNNNNDGGSAAGDKGCLVYSVGSAGTFMFENSILEEIGKHCEIHTFDPEIQGRKYGHLAPEGVNYHAWGFMSESGGRLAQRQYYSNVRSNYGNFKTMKDTIETLGHVGREIDVFKIDCEGCEWTTFEGWFDAGATLRQILVEVHNTPVHSVLDFFVGMQENGYVTFHKEPNIQWAGGNCVEYAFLKLEPSFFEAG